jgi:hypothetical protein
MTVRHPLRLVRSCALVLLVATAVLLAPTGSAAIAIGPLPGSSVGDGTVGFAPAGDEAVMSEASLVGTARYGVDYVKKTVDWPVYFRTLKATGRDFIGRYLPIKGAMQRCVTTTELAAAAAAGIDCFFWFETMDDLYRARDGYDAGVADANEALRALAGLGVPTTTPVYYTVDWGNSDGSQIDGYFKGIASVVPVSQIGVYGSYATIDWLYQRSMATYYCQSNAWRDPRGWHPQAQMHQNVNNFSIGGVWVDRLTVTVAEFGQNHRYQQTDTRLLYSGSWSTGTLPAGSYSGGSYGYSTATGASVTIAFNGTSLDWLAKTSPTPGTATVSVDGAASVPVNLSTSATVYKTKVWGTGPLPEGLHTVKITRSAGTLNVDAFDVSGSVAALTRQEETSGALLYSGVWGSVNNSLASGSYYRATSAVGAAVTVNFTGQRLDVLAITGPAMGAADFSVDGGAVTTVDLYSATASYKQRVWTTGELPAGLHTVTIVRNAASPTGSYLSLDALEIVGLAAPPPTITGLFRDYGSTGGNRTVVINGTGFTGLTGPDAVTFGGADAASYTVESSTKMTAVTPWRPAGVGMVRVQVTAAGGSTGDTAADDYTYMPPVAYTGLRGTDRIDTAIKISQAMFATALPAGSGLVLAPAETFQAALCASPLAAAYGGPVLLTYAGGLVKGVSDEMLRLAPSKVICVGLPALLVGQVAAAMGGGVTVTSISGAGGSVYDMSYQVAKALGDKVGDMSTATAIITIGTNFPDAIGVSALACAKLWPIILTDKAAGPTAPPLHASAIATLSDLGITKALKVGTYAYLPLGVTVVGSCSGVNRYATNVMVANWAAANAGLTFTHTGIATGDKFPDALAAGPYLAKDHGILLLTPLGGPLPVAVGALIGANVADVDRCSLIAMVEPVVGQVKALLP